MSIIKASGTTMGLELEIADVPASPPVTQIALFVMYRRLGTGEANGCVSSPPRLVDLVVPQAEGAALISRIVKWIAEIKGNQGVTPRPLADFPVELVSSIVPTPDGITYEFKMGDLSVEISWVKSTDLVTIFAGAAFTVTFEGFIYYVDTLVDLIRAIEVAKAG